MEIEERFHHANLGNNLKIESVEFADSKQVVFKFNDAELSKLQNEIGKVNLFQIAVQDSNRFDQIIPDVDFIFSDDYSLSFSSSTGKVDDDVIWELHIPDDAGFQGAIIRFVRLNYVLTDERLVQFKKSLLAP